MHKTASGERRRALVKEAQRLRREGKLVEKAAQSRPGLLAEVATILAMAEKEKETKKGVRTYSYWMASWRESGRIRHVYLGSCRKISREAALQKARKMKAQALRLNER
jgi:hypothetical protein